MPGIAEPSYAVFALVWGVMCLLAAAIVTETMLGDAASAPAHEAGEASAIEC